MRGGRAASAAWGLACALGAAAAFGHGEADDGPRPAFDPDAPTVRGVPARPTWHRHVAKIVDRHCSGCHRQDDIGPMPLTSAEDARTWIARALEEIEAGNMPPWKPTRGVGRFVDERGLSVREYQTLRAWRDAGTPDGRPRRGRPARRVPTSGWRLGEPDGVLDYGEAFDVPAQGEDVYRCFPVETPFDRDVHLSAVEVRPGDRRVVHHVVLYLDALGESAALDAAEPGPGYTCFGGPGTSLPLVLGGWAPGNRPAEFPRGTGLLLPRGTRVVVQVHYHPVGEPVADRTTVGLHLSADPSPREMLFLPVMNRSFTIPAGAASHPVLATLPSAELPLSVAGEIHAVMPHMHLLGRSIEVDLELPDGTSQRLVEILDWDFDWQDTYTFRRPVPAPAGSRIRLRAVYDNSAGNPANPNDPPLPVSWGDRTVDEMCLAFLAITPGTGAAASRPPEIRSARIDRRGRLVVRGRRFPPGGRMEIDGRPVGDSVARGRALLSAHEWLEVAPPFGPFELRVRRGDGRLSAAHTFDR